VPFIFLAALVLVAAYVAIKSNETAYWDTPTAQWFRHVAPNGVPKQSNQQDQNRREK